ncbi:amidohydrolase family protein [Streptomyces sp. 150FB]|uniref:metal-dependent hydrolase family protein n=1 Tax=Streptomyces sp. 150FB TaxID=1576605 RepID=UPI000696AEAD|nr:amidohydrolase family protein [Streptomyces sp. 150FB]
MRRTPHRDTWVSASRLWDGHADSPADGVSVLVRDGRVAEMTTAPPASPDADTVELPGCTLMPGFIDCHVHTLDERLDTASAAYQTLQALPALRTLLACGFTTVRDLGGAHQALNTALRRAVLEGLVTGPRMRVAPNILSPRGGHADKTPELAERYGVEVGTLADGPDELRRAVRQQARAGADWIKFVASGGFSSPADSPDDTAYSQAEMNVLASTARDFHLPCAAHAFDDESITRAIRAGVRSIEHACLATPSAYSLMAEYGTYLVPTQYAQTYFLERVDDESLWEDRPPKMHRAYRRYAQDLREGLRRPAGTEVKIAFGTDAGMFPYADSWREFPTLVDNGLSPLRALRAATSTAAELLGRPDLGRIAPGTTADLVALRGDPFQDINATGRVSYVMQGGHSFSSERLSDGPPQGE